MEYKTLRKHGNIGKGKLIVPTNNKRYNISLEAVLDLTGNITVGEETDISEGVKIFTHKHHWGHSKKLRKNSQKITKSDLIIGNDVFIGTNAIILGISYIGDGAVIGAGAVVTRNVEAYTIVAGNPAKVIGTRGIKL